MPKSTSITVALAVVLPAALLAELMRRRSRRARLHDALFYAARCGDLREVERVMSLPDAAAAAVEARDELGRSPADLALELRLHDAAALLGTPALGAGDRGHHVREWQADRVLDADLRTVSAKMRGPFGVKLPAVSALVEVDGKVMYERVDGYADMRKGILADGDTRFLIGSITKQFVAAAVLRLQDEGVVDVKTDTLGRWYPDFPRAEEVTLHHLLTHTSGLRDYLNEPGVAFAEEMLTEDEFLAHVVRFGYAFDPGERWAYSNSGYVLLGFVVQKASGKRLEVFMQETFFNPLSMEHTGMHNGDRGVYKEVHTVDGLVGYRQAIWPSARALIRGTPYAVMPVRMACSPATGSGGDGAIYSTARDLARWNRALFEEGVVISREALKQAITPVVLNDGSTTGEYGYGWVLPRPMETLGVVKYVHSGSSPGYTASLSYYPETKMTIVALSNADDGRRSAPNVAWLLDDVWTHNLRVAQRETYRANSSVSQEQLAKFVGEFEFFDVGDANLLRITQDQQTRRLSMFGWGSSPLVPVTANTVVATTFIPIISITLLSEESSSNTYTLRVERNSPGRKIYYGRRLRAEDKFSTYEARRLSYEDKKLIARCTGKYEYGRPPVSISLGWWRRNTLVAKMPMLGSVSLVHIGGLKFCIARMEPLEIVSFDFEDGEGKSGRPTHVTWTSPTEFPLKIRRLGDL